MRSSRAAQATKWSHLHTCYTSLYPSTHLIYLLIPIYTPDIPPYTHLHLIPLYPCPAFHAHACDPPARRMRYNSHGDRHTRNNSRLALISHARHKRMTNVWFTKICPVLPVLDRMHHVGPLHHVRAVAPRYGPLHHVRAVFSTHRVIQISTTNTNKTLTPILTKL